MRIAYYFFFFIGYGFFIFNKMVLIFVLDNFYWKSFRDIKLIDEFFVDKVRIKVKCCFFLILLGKFILV